MRFLGNRSSGKQGYALAAAAAARGADVTLVAANVVAPGPRRRARSCRSSTALELQAAVAAAAEDADVVVMAAAPADFRPAHCQRPRSRSRSDARRTRRCRRSSWCATPTSSPAWSRARGGGSAGRCIVGFAAETGDADRARSWTTPGPSSPARAATCMVVNEVGARPDVRAGRDDACTSCAAAPTR